ncbi:hypothetical protein AB1Y20_011737 [Prymnesium parvum]|uniref:F-box domain-containing protein n=1 Tax=Prymnesium parvum TaxID=97485 RepID=A0AB34IJZ5_PRYPA
MPQYSAPSWAQLRPSHRPLPRTRRLLARPHPPKTPLLLWLPDAVIFAVCELLGEADCGVLRTVCKELHTILRTPLADLCVWKPRLDALLLSHGVPPSTQPKHDPRAHELSLAFLRRYTKALGHYLWPPSAKHTGMVKVEVLRADRVVATLTARTRRRGMYYTLLLLDIRRGEGGADQLWVNCSEHSLHALSDSLRARPSSRAPGSTPPSGLPTRLGVCSLAPAAPHLVLQPIFYAKSAHGMAELMHVCRGELQLSGVDTQGATHGIHGKSLCADDDAITPQSVFKAWGRMFPPEQLSLLCPTHCRCRLPCDCIQAREVESGEIIVLGAMAAVIKAATPDFGSESNIRGKLIFYHRRTAVPLPPELLHVGSVIPGKVVNVLVMRDGPQFTSSLRLTPVAIKGVRSVLGYDSGVSGCAATDVA